MPWQCLINQLHAAHEQSAFKMLCKIASMLFHCPDSRDKYCRHVREYWVDVQTSGKFTSAENEEIRDTTIAEGEAENFVLGGIEPGPMRPDGEASDEEDEDGESDTEDDPKRGKGSGKRHLKPSEVAEEHALEAHCIVENPMLLM